MNHLTYQQTSNKPFKQYYDRFKKMVKEDLDGDGYFLLVKDFPFKDGDNIMFTAGENIGKWEDKSLESLYGKTKYILGRCRKKGPVLTLLDFGKGDYIKVATESGLRKELKEYFKGTGVTIRIFKSLKVSEPEPANEVEDELEVATAGTGLFSDEIDSIRNLEGSLQQKQSAISELVTKVLKEAQDAGITDNPKFNLHHTKLKNAMRGGKIDAVLTEVDIISKMVEEAGGGTSGNLEDLQKELKRLEDLNEERKKKTLSNMDAYLNKLSEVKVETAQVDLESMNKLLDESLNLLNEMIKSQEESDKLQEQIKSD